MQTFGINYQVAITFIIYSLFMLGIGFYYYKQNKDESDYFLGGREVGPFISALSAGASDMSGWLLMGLPGALYVGGLSESYIAIGLCVGASLNWMFIAKRLRIFTKLQSCLTIPDYFEARFADSSHVLRVLCAVVILVFFTFYVSSGLVGGAKLFESAFGVAYENALVTGTIIIVLYTFLGGYKAVCYTDMIQGLLIVAALVVVPCVMLGRLGGLDAALEVVRTINPDSLSMGKGVSTLAIISACAWGLGYFGQPHILVRFMSIKSVKDIPRATFIGIVWMGISLLGACLIGLLGVAYIHEFKLSFKDPEKIFILMSELLFNPWISGILLSAILAAIMSTASSQLLVSSSTLAEDFYKRILAKSAPPKTVMFLGRLGVLAVALVALLISYDKNSSVLSIVAYAWAGFGASFGCVMILSLFWSKMSRAGAICGMLTGALVVVLYKNFLAKYLGVYEIIPGFIVALLSSVLVSLVFKPDEATLKAFKDLEKGLDKKD